MGELILPIIFLILGFALLVYGADFFVDGCSAVAKALKIPSIIIGLTIVALGTSAPEAAVSITASLNGSAGLSAGNCVGSNFFNLLVVVGICAAFSPVPVSRDIIKRDFPFSIVVEGILLLLFADFFFGKPENVLGRVAGFSLFGLYLLYLIYLIVSVTKQRKQGIEVTVEGEDDIKSMPGWKMLVCIVFGAAAVVFGGNVVVEQATVIAKFFGMSDVLIGLTIVALGTSLPELVTSIVAAKKGEVELALGNCIGSNIANFLFVLGSAAAVAPITVDMKVITDTMILIAVSIVVFIMSITGKRLDRREGIAMLVMYAGYTVFIFMREFM